MTLIETPHLQIAHVAARDAEALAAYHDRNAAHLSPWTPRREEGYHSLAAWAERAADLSISADAGKSLHYTLRSEPEGAIVGLCGFTNIVRGAFQACHLGYSIDASRQGQGLMHEALSILIPHVFAEHGLHRIMANYLPHNARSERLLIRLGFEKEGYARDYLKIDGLWQDHVLTSRINDTISA